MDSEYLTVNEVAERLHVSPHTIYTWVRKRTAPPFMRFNGLIRFPKDQLEQWIEKSRVDCAA